MSDNNPYGVKPGQKWKDCDKRSHGRTVDVLNVGDTHAAVWTGSRRSKIRLDRFKPNSTGYRLVRDVKGT